MSADNSTRKANCAHPFNFRYVDHGHNIAMNRLRLGLTQKELADRLGVNQQDVSKIEKKAELDDETIIKYAEALGIDPQYIKDWTSDNSNNFFSVEHMGEGEGSTNMVGINNCETNHNVYIYPIDKICELYEVIREQDRKMYEMEIQKLTDKIEDYRLQLTQDK